MLKMISWDTEVSYYRPMLHPKHGCITWFHSTNLSSNVFVNTFTDKHPDVLNICKLCSAIVHPQHTLWLLLMWPPKFERTHKKKPGARSSLQEELWLLGGQTCHFVWHNKSQVSNLVPGSSKQQNHQFWWVYVYRFDRKHFNWLFVNLEYHH